VVSRLLVVVAVVSVALVVAVGLTHASYPVRGGEARCPDPVWRAALQGTGEDRSTPEGICTAESQWRLYAVGAGLMGLVIVSGLLHRRE
jgi:hypothetical protein